MDGIEATERIRAAGCGSYKTPIIALTAHALAEEKKELLNKGFDDYLTKPLQQRRLHEMMLRLIHGTSENQAHEPAAQIDRRSVKLSGPTPTILAVDDNDANLKLVEALLSDMMIKVHTATNGFEALSKAKQFQYDLIFMDVQMPGMDGIEATERIRAAGCGSYKTPIIALTAHALAEEKKELLNKGFDDYLTKTEAAGSRVTPHRFQFNATDKTVGDTGSGKDHPAFTHFSFSQMRRY